MKRKLLKRLLYIGFGTACLFAHSALAEPPGNWGGGYFGGHLGFTWGDFSNESGVAGPDGSSGNFMGGAQVGYNFQFNHLVLGAEADFSKINMESRNGTSTFNEDWMTTFRARAGYGFERFMPYVTLGLGLTDVVSKAPGMGTDSRLQPGIAAGGGFDFLLPNSDVLSNRWLARAEYLYVDVPTETTTVGTTPVAGGSGNHTFRIGLNYKF